MRFSLLIIFMMHFCSIIQSQNDKINIDNYYDFYNNNNFGTTDWLRRNEVVPIIIEELEKYNFKWNFEYELYEVNDTLDILLDIYSTQNNFGFIYKTGHYAIPNKKYKNDLKYEQVKYNNKGAQIRKEINLPENIFLLNENCYWYQYKSDKNELNDFVCRAKIIEILKTDIDNILKKFTNLDSALEEKKWIQITPDMESMRKMLSNSKNSMIGFNSQARFYNGKEALNKYFKDSTIYPLEAEKKKIEGFVIVEYTINTNGGVENPTIIESSNKIFNNEAIRVVSKMPKWKPALSGKNEKIPMIYRQKINFSLN